MKDLMFWMIQTDEGDRWGWVVTAIIVLTWCWMHLMWFFKRPIWKSIVSNSFFAPYILVTGCSVLVSSVVTGLMSLQPAVHNNVMLPFYTLVSAPILLLSIIIIVYMKLLKLRANIPEA